MSCGWHRKPFFPISCLSGACAGLGLQVFSGGALCLAVGGREWHPTWLCSTPGLRCFADVSEVFASLTYSPNRMCLCPVQGTEATLSSPFPDTARSFPYKVFKVTQRPWAIWTKQQASGHVDFVRGASDGAYHPGHVFTVLPVRWPFLASGMDSGLRESLFRAHLWHRVQREGRHLTSCGLCEPC